MLPQRLRSCVRHFRAGWCSGWARASLLLAGDTSWHCGRGCGWVKCLFFPSSKSRGCLFLSYEQWLDLSIHVLSPWG